MLNHALPEKFVRYALGTLLLVIAINAFGGGYYGMSGAKYVPLEWLKGSPFHNYFIPGLFLFVCIGGLSLFSSVAIFKRFKAANTLAFISGMIVILWLIIQVPIIGYVSWMQPATAVIAILIISLTRQLAEYGH